MTHYRLYRINGSGRIFGVLAAECENDEHAARLARSTVHEVAGCATIEVWDRARQVARVHLAAAPDAPCA